MRSRRVVRPLLLLLAVVAGTAVLSSCGDDGDPVTSTTSTTASTTTTAPTVTVATTVPPVSVPPTSSTAYLTSVTVAGTPSGDTITFGFDNQVPGYSVAYQDGPLLNDPQGSPVTVAGGKNARIVLSLASDVKLTGGVGKTYNGPDRITPTGTSVVKEVAKLGDFESVLSWGVGTSRVVPFTVASPDSHTLVVTFAG
jgi:hypothetical protein